MDFDLTEDQKALVDAIQSIVQDHLDAPRDGNVARAVHHHYSAELDASLDSGGFFEVAREESLGPLAAVLLVEEVYRTASVIEIGTSAVVVPQLTSARLPRPVALLRRTELDRPVRFLGIARSALLDLGEEAAMIELVPEDVEPVESLYAYPFGRFVKPPKLLAAQRMGPGSGVKLRSWWRVALAAEIGAAMLQAITITTEYVKQRRQFGREIGSYQGVKHRLAADIQMAESVQWLARRAAWTGDPLDAASAALYAQQSIEPVCYDCHQFHGAIGLTLEYPLHFWTQRLRAMQGELGGWTEQAAGIARMRWNLGVCER